MNGAWFRRRFWEFRHGHSTYLGYALAFINFITITYSLLISNVSFLSVIFPHWWVYAIMFSLVYPPLAIFIGHNEFRRKQYPTDVEVATLQNPFIYKVIPGKELELTFPTNILYLKLLLQISDALGKLTPQEKKEAKRLIREMQKLVEGKTLQR